MSAYCVPGTGWGLSFMSWTLTTVMCLGIADHTPPISQRRKLRHREVNPAWKWQGWGWNRGLWVPLCMIVLIILSPHPPGRTPVTPLHSGPDPSPRGLTPPPGAVCTGSVYLGSAGGRALPFLTSKRPGHLLRSLGAGRGGGLSLSCEPRTREEHDCPRSLGGE